MDMLGIEERANILTTATVDVRQGWYGFAVPVHYSPVGEQKTLVLGA